MDRTENSIEKRSAFPGAGLSRRILLVYFPFVAFGMPDRPPAYLRRDVGLPPDEEARYWRRYW